MWSRFRDCCANFIIYLFFNFYLCALKGKLARHTSRTGAWIHQGHGDTEGAGPRKLELPPHLVHTKSHAHLLSQDFWTLKITSFTIIGGLHYNHKFIQSKIEQDSSLAY